MSNGRLTVMIGGREALPIRAIPYVTAWRESPDSIVSALARPATIDCGKGQRIRNRYALRAYQLLDQGHCEPIPASQWKDRVTALKNRTSKLKADEREGATDENHGPWRIDAILSLRDDVFVWLDEFKAWFAITRPLVIQGGDEDARSRMDEWQAAQESSDPDLQALDELESELLQNADDSLCLMAMLPPEIEGKVWRYGDVVVSVANPRDVPHEVPKDRDDEAVAVLAQLPTNENRALDSHKTGAADRVDADGSIASGPREPSLKGGPNRREAVEQWVAWHAKDMAKDYGTCKDLAAAIKRIADRNRYESARGEMTLNNILRMLPKGVTGGRGKKAARAKNRPGIVFGQAEREANGRK